MQIPLCDPKQAYLALKDEIDAGIRSVCESGNYILGPNVKAFEQEIVAYLGCSSAVGVNSGTDALHLALRALDIGPGDEVITTPFTFIATTEAIGMVGATPVFADIDPQTFNIDPSCIEAAITPNTKAILPVHLYGQPCDMDAIMNVALRHRLYVVEDCAQAIGASHRGKKVGTFGNVGCFSFFPSKNLGCFGDGGMVVTSDADTYERIEMLRQHGGKVKYRHEELGINSRLDEIQSAVLRVKLKHLDAWNRLRRERAYTYNRLLEKCAGTLCPAELGPHGPYISLRADETSEEHLAAVYHQYTILVDDRDEAMKGLAQSGTNCAIYYPIPLHLQAVHAELCLPPGSFPNAESASQRCLSLPIFPEMTESDQRRVADSLARFSRLKSRAA